MRHTLSHGLRTLVLLSTVCLALAPALAQTVCTTCSPEQALVPNTLNGTCGNTTTAAFSLTRASYVSRISIWYDSTVGGSRPSFAVSSQYGVSGTATKGACQGNWCEAILTQGRWMVPGSYTVRSYSILNGDSLSAMCAAPTGQSALTVYGWSATPWDVTPSSLSEAEVAALVAVPQFGQGHYFGQLSQDPMGYAAASLRQTQTRWVGDTLRVENILVGDQQFWLDFKLTSTPQGVSLVPSGSGQGLPTGALSGNTIPGLDTSTSFATLYGPPLSIGAAPLPLSGKNYGISFALQSNGNFVLNDLQELTPAASKTLAPRAAVTSDIDTWINDQGRAALAMPSESALGTALEDCVSKGLSSLNMASRSLTVTRNLLANLPMMREIRANYEAGDSVEAGRLLASYVLKALIDNDESTAGLSDLNDYLGIANQAAFGTCQSGNAAALKAVLAGLTDKLMPMSTCAANLLQQTGAYAIDYLQNKEWEKVVQNAKAAGDFGGNPYGSDSTVTKQSLDTPPGPNLIFLVGQREFSRFSDPTRSRMARAKLSEMLDKRYAFDNDPTLSKRLTRLREVRNLYATLSPAERTAYEARAATSDTSTSAELKGFAYFDRQLQKVRNKLAPFRPTDLNNLVSDSDMDGLALGLIRMANASAGGTAYQTALAGEISKLKKLSMGCSGTSSTAAACNTPGYPLSAACPLPTATPAPPTSSETVTTGYLTGWCDLPVTLRGAKLATDAWVEGWRNNGEQWSAVAVAPNLAITVPIVCDNRKWSYFDYTYDITITASGGGGTSKTLLHETGTMSKDGGSKSFTVNFDAVKEKSWFGMFGGLSVSAKITGGNPDSSTHYTTGSVSVSTHVTAP